MAAQVTINSYNKSSGCIYFTITGTPLPASISVEQSIDGGVTWDGEIGDGLDSPLCGYFVLVATLFRLVLNPYGIYSNEFLVSNVTPIDSANKIRFCNSPIFLRENATIDTKSIKVELYIWDGLLSALPSLPSQILKKEKVSPTDDYISLEISDLIRPYINPKLAVNRLLPPAITNQGVFVQAQITTTNFDLTQTVRVTSTFFVTLGYLWNYEQNTISSNGVNNYGANGFLEPVNKWYNPKIDNYFIQGFDFTKSVADATSSNIITYDTITPPNNWLRCTLDSTLIIFLNKLGLWEQFTPHGKFTASTSVKRTSSDISHRDPSQIDNTYIHSKVVNSIDVKQSYVINSGSLTEDMDSIIEELIYSPLVYLIDYKGDLEETTTIGITIDNTFITIDNTDITIDSQTATANSLGKLKTFKQIPVIVVDEDFTRKTRLNNKLDLDYNIKLEETNNKINQIR